MSPKHPFLNINLHISHPQGSLFLVAISLLILGLASEYRHLCLLAWMYGLGLGSFRYSMKMLALERIRAKHFTKAWGFIKTAEAIPVLFGIPLVSFLNEASSPTPSLEPGQPQHILHHGRAGYFVCSAAAAISTVLLFFIGHPERRYNRPAASAAASGSCNGSLISHCGAGAGPLLPSECPDLLNRSFNSTSGRYAGGAAQQWYPSPFTGTTRCSAGGGSIYPAQHHHAVQQLPPAYNHNPTADQQQHCQRMNGGVGGGAAAAAAGGTGSRPHPPRLQKSLSFAFQTPPASLMWNEQDQRHHQYFHAQQPQHNGSTYPQQQMNHHAVSNGGAAGGGPCFYSRCSSR